MKKIFDGISSEEQARLLVCIKASAKSFRAQDTIMSSRENSGKSAALLSGEAAVLEYDEDGNIMLLERIFEGGVFGELFTRLDFESGARIVCVKPCRVLFFDKAAISEFCPKACECHKRFLQNILEILSERTAEQSERVAVLSQRTLRKKLMRFFSEEAKRQGKPSFTLPYSLSSLADYLSVDRAAMMRELKKMREDGLIVSHARKITVL